MVTLLTPRQESLIRLHYYEGLSLTAIASLYGVSKPTVSVMHRRALLHLRKALSDRGIEASHL